MLKVYYAYPASVITTMVGVSPSSEYWTYQPPKGVGLKGKRLLKSKTLPALYDAMRLHGVDVDSRCDITAFVNESPSKLAIGEGAVTARVMVTDDLGVTSMPSFRFEFKADDVASFTSAIKGALNILEVEKMNNRLNQLVKYLRR